MAGPVARPTTDHVGPIAAHVADNNIQAFLQQDFDPAAYLNSTLPSLSASKSITNTQHGRAVPLPELSAQLQTLLSQLNAQTTRLSNTLTQLTDEIIRSGNRLAYEVEVLRGDTIGLTDTLDNGLKHDIEMFTVTAPVSDVAKSTPDGDQAAEADLAEPEYLARLRTLTAVRSRLEAVIKVFGDAMAWPIPPSELSSIGSSLISVAGPENDADTRSREEKGKAYAENLRIELNDLIGTGNDMAGLEAAATRIEQLRELAEVWKGTAEDKARLKLVDSLAKPIEERQKMLAGGKGRKDAVSPVRGVDYRYGNLDAGQSGYGFLQNLKKLKDEMYLD